MSESHGTREGYHTITPRIVVDDVSAQVHFLRIGDSLLMVTSATERDRFPAFLYVYVSQADEVYQRAIAAGATSLEAPIDTPYGDRRGMVRDPFGNIFQIAHPIAAAS